MSELLDIVEAMNTGALLGLAGAAGGIAGGVSYGVAGYKTAKPVSEWADRIRAEDIECLETGRALPPMPEPPGSDRRPRKRWLIYLVSIVATAAVVAIIGGLAVALIVHGVSGTTDMMPGERALAFVITGVTGAVIGAIIGGIMGGIIGGILDVREMRARLHAAREVLIRIVWEHREELRTDLAERTLSPQAAISQLLTEMDT